MDSLLALLIRFHFSSCRLVPPGQPHLLFDQRERSSLRCAAVFASRTSICTTWGLLHSDSRTRTEYDLLAALSLAL